MTSSEEDYERYFRVLQKCNVTDDEIVQFVQNSKQFFVTTACRDAAKAGKDNLTMRLIDVAHARREHFAVSAAMVTAYEHDHYDLYNLIKAMYFPMHGERQTFTIDEALGQ